MRLKRSLMAFTAAAAATLMGSANAQPQTPTVASQIDTVVVTVARTQLLGSANTSSQGVVTQQELELTPAYRPGQLLETVPGLVVTSHSGEGKANQYLMRGFNLDHGTDLGTFVDDMPVNEPTHAHGQGYTDLNFMIPELVSGIEYTKGTYFAAEGDFASVGSDHISYLNSIDDQASATVGALGFERLFTAGSMDEGQGTLLGALEFQHYDGPWKNPDNQRKVNAVIRYSEGDSDNGYSITGMYYGSLWNATTDQPERAIAAGLIGRFGSLDPSDGGLADRISLTGQYHSDTGLGHLDVNAYAFENRLTLWNDFTHFLVDPINGDQEAQNEARTALGGGVSDTFSDSLFGSDNEFVVGLQTRYDNNHISRDQTKDRMYLSTTESDYVNLADAAVYAQDTTHWTSWFRSVVGLREDYIAANDDGSNPGSPSDSIFEPKGSLIFGPWNATEFYVSAGQGFHSDDVRGVDQAAITGIAGAPLIAHQFGEEAGVRSTILPNLTATLTAFQLDSQSETTYDPDVGQDAAGPGSNRDGIEFNTTYQATQWLEIYTSFAASHARYTTPFDDGTGRIGEFIPNAPNMIGSLEAYFKNLGAWSGSLEYRYLGEYSLTPDNSKKAPGYGEWNGEVSYTLQSGWQFSLGLYNILNVHANAAEFWYIDRLPGEPAAGVADIHIHPLEPISGRFTLSKML
jgi:outer membrane receptor protein involved in Fe transport